MKKIIFFLFCILVSCERSDTFALDEGQEQEERAEFVIYKARVIQQEEKRLEITVDEMFYFADSNRYHARGILFAEYDESQHPGNQGSLGELFIDNDSGDAEMYGGVELHLSSQELTLKMGDASWVDDEKTLKSEEGDVTLQTDTGSLLSGKGFVIDSRTQDITFFESVEGVIQTTANE